MDKRVKRQIMIATGILVGVFVMMALLEYVA
jgi:hypothetical protein